MGAGNEITPWGLAAAGLLGLGWMLSGPSPQAHGTPVTELAPVASATPGYVPDQACRLCHSDQYTSFQAVGMAQAFFRPTPDRFIEDFEDNHYHHPPSDRHYEMIRRGDDILFRRYQVAADGTRINQFEVVVDWILGSGNHSRTYLFRTPSGELYQLPIAWYTQTATWRMAPGFEGRGHRGVTRIVRRECMFCHNAYPDVPAGSDRQREAHVFPESLPEGIGCQRCHGPGQAHMEAATGGGFDAERIRSSIVNPSRLEQPLRNDVCYQCHMQPSVIIPGVRHFDVGDFAFRAGQSLSDYLVGVDVVEIDQPSDERFEINHHPYRLEQSRCFVESAGALTCTTCHDPHRKVAPASRADHFRAACLRCHVLDDCARDAMISADGPASAAEADDCVACHMHKRRTQDVVEVVMTDHRILRHPGGPELLAPLEHTEPGLSDIIALDPERAPPADEWSVYRAIALLRTVPHEAAADFLAAKLGGPADRRPFGDDVTPDLELAEAQLKLGRYNDVLITARRVLARKPNDALAFEWLGMAYAGLDDVPRARGFLLKSVSIDPQRPTSQFNLGVILVADRQPQAALDALDRAIELRPNLSTAWFYRGRALLALDRAEEAAASFRRSLSIEPNLDRAYAPLGQTLIALGKVDEAERYLRFGLSAGFDREALAKTLADLEKGP